MKRFVFFVSTVIVLFTLFYLKNQNNEKNFTLNEIEKKPDSHLSSGGQINLASQTESSRKNSNIQASSITEYAVKEDIFFQDNPEKLDISEDQIRRMRSNKTLFPKKKPELQISSLWPQGPWQFWKGVRLVPKENLTEQQIANQLGQMGYFIMVEDAATVIDEHHFSSLNPIPIFNPDRNKSGFISGVFKIVLNDEKDFESLAADYGLIVKAAFVQIKTFYVNSSQEPFDLYQKWESLKQDPRILKADLEIVSASYDKK